MKTINGILRCQKISHHRLQSQPCSGGKEGRGGGSKPRAWRTSPWSQDPAPGAGHWGQAKALVRVMPSGQQLTTGGRPSLPNPVLPGGSPGEVLVAFGWERRDATCTARPHHGLAKFISTSLELRGNN